MKKANSKTPIKPSKQPKVELSKKSPNSPNSAPNGDPEMRFPDLSIEKETALILFANGYSQRQICKKLGFHHSTFYSWKTKDSVFSQHLADVKTFMHEKVKDESPCIVSGMHGAILAFAQTDWSKLSISELILAAKMAKDYLISTGNLVPAIDPVEEERRKTEVMERISQFYEEYYSQSNLEANSK